MIEISEQDERELRLTDAQSVLEWLAAHPEIPLPSEFSKWGHLNIYAWDNRKEARVMARAMGTFEKQADTNMLRLLKRFGRVTVCAVFRRRQVCERIVVDTKEIPEEVIPAKTVPAHVEEVIVWRCPSLLDDEAMGASNE